MAPFAIQTARKAQYVLLEVSLPGRAAAAGGVILLDPSTDRFYLKLRQDWDSLADAEDVEVLEHLAADIEADGKGLGGEGLLRRLEDALSNTVRLSERAMIAVGDFDRALERLYQRYVEKVAGEPAAVIPFRTHLPSYSLAAAAGGFGQDMEVEAEDWVRAPGGLQLDKDMFVAQVVGHSMEPLIPDGSLCVFRHNVVGSRQGRLVLVRHLAASGSGGEFTIKRYTSTKTQSEEGWRHKRIRLEPLNPEYEAWDLDAADLEDGPYRVLAEFLRVVPFEEQ